jgi:hypothetical protein
MMLKLLSTLRSLANAILGKTGKPDRVDTATRMAMDADFSSRREPSTPKRQLAEKVDPIDELKRIIGEQETEPRTPHRTQATKLSDRRRRPKGRE